MTKTEKDSSTAKILLVDDHWAIREGLSRLIETDKGLEVRGVAADATEAYDEIMNETFDLAIVDISLPGINGIQLTEKIIQADRNISVLIHSMHNEPCYVKRAFNAGAMGFVAKNETAEMLIKAIHTILGGGRFISDEIAAQMQEQTQDPVL